MDGAYPSAKAIRAESPDLQRHKSEKDVKARILVVDDEDGMRVSLQKLFEQSGYSVIVADNALKGLKITQEYPIDLIVCDIVMPDMSGLTFLSKISRSIPVIIITAYASVETARTAFKSGARDYLVKPFEFSELLLLVRQYIARGEADSGAVSAEDALLESDDPTYKKLVHLAMKIGPTDIPVLLLGESGTGKEVLANSIHNASGRASAPFIKVNCAAIPEPLLESELFGYEKGAFTGAAEVKRGLFECAQGGTFFLDEIGDMPVSLQAKLLRTLQSLSVVRLGGTKEIHIDCRIISASNKPLDEMIAMRQFREDLYYRLNGIQLKLPPLRERGLDVLRLAAFFLADFRVKYGKEICGFDQGALERIRTYCWPGNIRELKNCVERAIVICESDRIGISDLPDIVAQDGRRVRSQAVPSTASDIKKDYMRKLLSSTLKKTGGNKAQAANILKVTRRTLYNWLSEYGLDDEG